MVRLSCVYEILNINNQKRYIGSSVDYYRRHKVHKRELLCNKHKNARLQFSYNKHGIGAFQYNIIEECPQEKLTEREAFYITHYNTTDDQFGYNIMQVNPDTQTICVISKEARAKANLKTLKTKAEKYGQITQEKAREIRSFYMDGYERHELCKMFGLGKQHLGGIIGNRSSIDPTYDRNSFRRKYLNPEKRAKIDQLFEQGVTPRKIYETLKVPRTRVYAYLSNRYQKYTHEHHTFLDQATGIYYEGLADLANRLGTCSSSARKIYVTGEVKNSMYSNPNIVLV